MISPSCLLIVPSSACEGSDVCKSCARTFPGGLPSEFREPAPVIPALGSRLFLTLSPSFYPRSLSNAKPGERVQQSKSVEEPYHHANDNHSIQDRLDGTCHWNEPINQPEDHPDDDQGEQYLN